MSSQVWRLVYETIQRVDKQIERPERRPVYSDVLIVAMYVWAALHDRPQGWACQRENYSSLFRPRRLPSESRFSRRIRSERCHRLFEGLYHALARTDQATPIAYLDARPLVVGACSKDRGARAGRVYGGFARGYKLHQLVAEDHRVLCWSISSLNESEPVQALALIDAAVSLSGCILADGNYDHGELFQRVESRGAVLISAIRPSRLKTPPRAHRNTPARLRAVHQWTHGLARYVHRDRAEVERAFAHQSAYGGGLAPLPAWVRTPARVRRWVGAKLILHHARLILRTTAA